MEVGNRGAGESDWWEADSAGAGWDIIVEALISRELGIGPDVLAGRIATDVLAFYARAVVSQGEVLQWKLTLADFPNMDRLGRQSVVGEVNGMLMRFRRRRSAIELGTAEEKLRIIGAQLDAMTKAEWLERSGQWVDWLYANGLSEADALLAWRQWTERVKVVRKAKPQVVKKTRRKVINAEGERPDPSVGG